MDQLLALSIGGTPIIAPSGIPTGGLPEAYTLGSNFVLLAYVIAILLALGFLILGGIKWVTSQGDKTKVQSARNTIVYSIVGLVIIFLSYFIINVITYIFNAPSVTDLPNTSHEGQFGCFDDKNDKNLPPACYGYTPNNDPKNPRSWYDDSATCEQLCK